MWIRVNLSNRLSLLLKAEQLRNPGKNHKMTIESIILKKLEKSLEEDKELLKYVTDTLLGAKK